MAMKMNNGSENRIEGTVAEYATALVVAAGSDVAFSLTGGMAMHINRAVASNSGLRVVYCQHEQACVAAAEGYSKTSGFRKAGFAVVTAGPGVSNTLTALISAYGDSTPLVVLAGQIKTADIDRFGTRTHGPQEVKSREIVSPCVKRFVRVAADSAKEEIASVIRLAFDGRPGPVFVEIPLDVQAHSISWTSAELDQFSRNLELLRTGTVESDVNKLQQALESFALAKRPLLYIGNGCRISGVGEAAVQFAVANSIPCAFSWLSFDLLSASHALNFGCPGGLAPIASNEVLAGADAILFLGARLDLGTTAFQRESFGEQAHRIYVDVDEAELRKFAGYPHSNLVHANLRSLPEAISRISKPSDTDRYAWLDWCAARRSKYRADEEQRLASGELNVYNIAKRLSKRSQDKVFVSASSGYAEETFTRFFEPDVRTRFFNGAALGSMGLGLPHAIGAAAATDQIVYCLEADGGLMLNLQELATLRQLQPKGFILFILNNDGYESIRLSQSKHFGAVAGADSLTGLFIPDYSKVAAAFNIAYTSVSSLAEFDRLLSDLPTAQPPQIVDLKIVRSENRGPSVKTLFTEDGKPYSTPIVELAW